MSKEPTLKGTVVPKIKKYYLFLVMSWAYGGQKYFLFYKLKIFWSLLHIDDDNNKRRETTEVLINKAINTCRNK